MSSCSCVICEDRHSGRDAAIVGQIREHGWCVLRVAGGEFEFACTVGRWHTFRRPEIVVFGLDGQLMQHLLNSAVEAAPSAPDVPFTGVLEGYPTVLRTVHPDWFDPLFGTLARVYDADVPVEQLVWPDRDGLWPWDDSASASCRTRQAWAWLPVSEHPAGGWRLVGELEPDFPFPVGPDSWALTTASIVADTRKPLWVLHDGGVYDVLDERRYDADDLCLAYLGDIVRRHPELTGSAARPASELDRRRSQKAWESVR